MYMLDWIALFLSVLGIILNARRKIACWAVWSASNAAWLVVAIQTNQTPLAIMQVAFIVLNIFGYRSWKKLSR